MSSTSYAVTYTSVYTDSEPRRVFWGAEEELSDGGSPRPIYPEYTPLKDEHILLAEKQPLPPVISPTTESPRHVVESDLKEDPEEYETEDGPVDYPMDGGDDRDDDDDGDSSGYDADDEDEDDEDEEEEEEEHLALADSTVVIPIDELVSPPEGTQPTIPPPSTDTTTIGARITIRPQTSISLPPEAEVERLLAIPTPSPSPLTSLSPPSAEERLARCTAPAALPSPPLPPFSYPQPPVDRRDGIPVPEKPPRKRLCLSTLGSKYEVGESSTRGRGVDYRFTDTVEAEMRHQGIREVWYGIRDTWIDLAEAVPDMVSTTLEKVNTRVTELAKLHEHDTQDLYALLEDAQDGRTRISQWVAMDSQRVNLLMGDRTTLQETFIANENEKIDKYISGLPDNIYGNVKSSKPRTLDETIEFTNDLMDQKLRTYTERADNKRKTDDTSRNNHGHQQQPFKKQNVSKVYNMETGERKPYEGSLPMCTKCQRHFKKDFPKLKKKNDGNRNAQGWVYTVGNTEKNGNAPTNPNSNVVTGTFLLNNRYASILFDTGADRSFISIAFSSLVNDPTPLGSSYDVDLANGKIVGIDTIIRGCTINFLNHPFIIDLMPVELGSFVVIIGMDWLRRCHAVIVCDEKLVQIPYGNETLT
nr:hypothetical protein [Tanacetum cinerariifolium]